MKKQSMRLMLLVGILVGLGIVYGLNFRQYTAPLKHNKKIVANQVFESSWQREDYWIIQSILSDIYGMIAHHAHPENFSYKNLSIDIQVSGYRNEDNKKDPVIYNVTASFPEIDETIGFELNFEAEGSHIFSPQSYWDWTRTLIDLMIPELSPAISSHDDNMIFLKTLLSPTGQILQRENQDLSRKLSNDAMSADNHSAAALLIGVFSMREAAGRYSDLRANLCRMSAHLSISGAIKPRLPEDKIQTIAIAVHELLLDNQVLALEEIATLNASQENDAYAGLYRVWKDALYARITGDYRVLSEKPSLSLLERMELFRALCFALSTDRALTWLQHSEANQIPYNEAARVVAMTDYSLATGHSLIKNGSSAELSEFIELTDGDSPTIEKKTLATYLNQAGGYAVDFDKNYNPKLQVISSGAWSQFFQRHLMHRLESEFLFYRKKWGVKAYAQDFYRYALDHFSGLNLFPVFMRAAHFETSDFTAALEKMNPTIKKTPELLTPQCYLIFTPLRGEMLPEGSVLRNMQWDWYLRGLLPGTIYQLEHRKELIVDTRDRLACLERSLSVAPYNWQNVESYCNAQRGGKRISKAALQGAYAPLQDFHLPALKKFAKRYQCYVGEIEKIIDLYDRICIMDPDQYFEIGKLLKGMGRIDEAAKAYQHGIDKSTSPLNVANESDWLVMYYHERGETEKAMEIAKIGARVGSYLGFWTMAELLDRQGDTQGAEVYYRKIYERYQDPALLVRFFRKHEAKPEFQAKIDTLLQKVFPEGFRPVAIDDASGPPRTGLIFTKRMNWMRRTGLAPGDIIIAVNGYSVANTEQLLVAGEYGGAMIVNVIVWQQSRFRELQMPRFDGSIIHIVENFKRPD